MTPRQAIKLHTMQYVYAIDVIRALAKNKLQADEIFEAMLKELPTRMGAKEFSVWLGGKLHELNFPTDTVVIYRLCGGEDVQVFT